MRGAQDGLFTQKDLLGRSSATRRLLPERERTGMLGRNIRPQMRRRPRVATGIGKSGRGALRQRSQRPSILHSVRSGHMAAQSRDGSDHSAGPHADAGTATAHRVRPHAHERDPAQPRARIPDAPGKSGRVRPHSTEAQDRPERDLHHRAERPSDPSAPLRQRSHLTSTGDTPPGTHAHRVGRTTVSIACGMPELCNRSFTCIDPASSNTGA